MRLYILNMVVYLDQHLGAAHSIRLVLNLNHFKLESASSFPEQTEALDQEQLAGGILFQEPYPTEAYNENLLMDNRFCNLAYLNLSQLPNR